MQIWLHSHDISSPHYPQANAEAQSGADSVASTDQSQRHKALMDYRNTSLKEINVSPAQLTYDGSQTEDQPPSSIATVTILSIRQRSKNSDQKEGEAKTILRQVHGTTSARRDSPMKHGEKWIPTKDLPKQQSLSSYFVESEQIGQKYPRNRHYLWLWSR